jgi:hypothetical protein
MQKQWVSGLKRLRRLVTIGCVIALYPASYGPWMYVSDKGVIPAPLVRVIDVQYAPLRAVIACDGFRKSRGGRLYIQYLLWCVYFPFYDSSALSKNFAVLRAMNCSVEKRGSSGTLVMFWSTGAHGRATYGILRTPCGMERVVGVDGGGTARPVAVAADAATAGHSVCQRPAHGHQLAALSRLNEKSERQFEGRNGKRGFVRRTIGIYTFLMV